MDVEQPVNLITNLSSSLAFDILKALEEKHQGYTESKTLGKHPINVAFKLINAFFSLTFKNKDSPESDLELILALGNVLGIMISKQNISTMALKNKSFQIYVKDRLTQLLHSVINSENNVKILKFENSYKSYIEKGNNGMLVRSVLKQRWWWTSVKKKEIANSHLIWTQWRKNNIYSMLSEQNKPSLKDGEGDQLTNSIDKINLEEETSLHEKETLKNHTSLACFNKLNALQETRSIYNHLAHNYHLSNKKAIFYNLKYYYETRGCDPFKNMPLTFHIKGIEDKEEYQKFVNTYQRVANEKYCDNIWIIKPGENTNRGNGITISKDLTEITNIIANFQGPKYTCILQKYIEKPLLINARKFDIRCFSLLTSINKRLKAYFYQEGYLRTSVTEFNLNSLEDRFIHLTNDAVQIKSKDYGKYEDGNKLSFADFQKYLNTNYPDEGIDFNKDIFSKIQMLVEDSIRAVYKLIDPERICNCIEVIF